MDLLLECKSINEIANTLKVSRQLAWKVQNDEYFRLVFFKILYKIIKRKDLERQKEILKQACTGTLQSRVQDDNVSSG